MGWWFCGSFLFLAAMIFIIFPFAICRYRMRRDCLDGAQPALLEIIHAFEQRASNRQSGSHAILVLILILLAVAAWVFVEAKAITTRETSSDFSQKLSQAQTKLDTDVSEQNRIKGDLITAVTPIINMIGHQGNPGADDYFSVEFLDNATHKTKDPVSIAKDVQNLQRLNRQFATGISIGLTMTGHRIDPSSGRIVPNPILTLVRTLTSDDVTKLANEKNLWEPHDLASLINQYDRLSHDIEVDNGGLSRIANEMRKFEISKAAGEESSSDSGNLSFPFLLQLNITRFGTITLVSIAIAILAPLYRFSERLAAFYPAFPG